jgi:hypothetical protein
MTSIPESREEVHTLIMRKSGILLAGALSVVLLKKFLFGCDV